MPNLNTEVEVEVEQLVSTDEEDYQESKEHNNIGFGVERSTNQQDEDVINTSEGLVFNPYNPLNLEISRDDVVQILKRFNIHAIPNNMALYQRAFIHKSYTKRPAIENQANNITIAERPSDCMTLKTKSNERLEFLGDGVLECITKYYLYRRFPKADEGFMTEKKIALVKNDHIGRLAYEMGLYKWFVVSKHAEEKKTRTNMKKLGCLFEAFIGALFLDFNKIDISDDKGWFENVFATGPGFQMAQIFVEHVFEELVDWGHLINNDDNYKNRLQVIVQKEFKITPDYVELSVDDAGYTMGLFIAIGDKIYNMDIGMANHYDRLASGFKTCHELADENNGCALIFLTKSTHKIKKKAEQQACKDAIKLLSKYDIR